MKLERWSTEFRAAEGGTGVRGHASVFDQVARIRNGYERIDHAAFDRALREKHDVVLLFNHDGQPLGRTTSGTLRLGTDEVGLTVDADLPDTQLGRDVRTLMERGDLRQMSFGFIPRADRIDTVEGRAVRTITDLDLFDVSIVTFPAYTETTVTLRQFDLTDARPARLRDQLIRARARVHLGE